MRRALLAVLFVLPWGILVFLAWQDLRELDIGSVDASTAAHGLAYQTFFADMAYEGCVARDSVTATAEARGWAWFEIEEPRWCHAPALSNWIEVQVEPPLPFSSDDENAAFIGFDESGCMARWESAACN